MKYKPIKLDNCVYLLPIPDMATDNPMSEKDETILELATKLEKLTEHNSSLTKCEHEYNMALVCSKCGEISYDY